MRQIELLNHLLDLCGIELLVFGGSDWDNLTVRKYSY